MCCTIFVFSLISARVGKLPNNIMLLEGEQQLFDIRLPINVSIDTCKNDVFKLNGSTLNGDRVKLSLSSPFKIESEQNGSVDFHIKLLGFIPIKHVTVKVVPQVKIIPGGQPVGVKLTTKGVMIVGVSPVVSTDGKQYSPSAASGLEVGDTITEINGVKVKDGEHVSKIVRSCNGKTLKITVQRKTDEFQVVVKPVKSKDDNQYKIGLWIRDSTAGVGTLTFYCPSNGYYGALGHPITDVDTGVILSVNSGKIIPSKIISIQPGVRGRPGELKGLFVDNGEELGTIEKNTLCGIYGKASHKIKNSLYDKPIPIGLQSQIKEGPAKILSTIEGGEVKEYDIVIEKVTNQTKPNPKSMIIRVTDEELLSKTGGIVQGMSGSPIIQEGKIVGAVTHVFINRPDMGYGIYIEWMLQEAGIDIGTGSVKKG